MTATAGIPTGPGIPDWTPPLPFEYAVPLRLRGSGIPADGTDQYAAIQAVLTAAGSAGERRRVIHEGGTLRFDTPLTIPDGVELYLAQPESVLDGSRCAAQANLIAAGGTEDMQRLLTANAAVGAVSVSVVAGMEAGILAGDWCRVGSQRLYAVNPASTSGVDQYIGELIQVESVASGLVTFKTPLDGGPYNTAESAFISKLTMVNEVRVFGRGKIVGGGDTKSHRAIQFSRCTRPKAQGIRIEGCVEMAVQFYDCVDFTEEGVHAEAGVHTNQLSYATSIAGACQDGTVANTYAREYRHAFTCGGGTTTARPGINRRINFVGVHGIDTASAAFDVHAGVENVTMDICKAFWTGVIEGSGGISCRSPWATIVNCSVKRPSTYGMWLRNQSDQPTRWLIDNNVIDTTGSGENGIMATVTLPTTPQTVQSTEQEVSITNNELRNIGGNGIDFDGGTTAGRLKGAKITGNEFYTVTGNAINTQQTDDLVISNNIGTGIVVHGIFADDSDDGTITGNRLTGDAGAGDRGVALSTNCDGWTITGNRLKSFGTGVLIGNTCTTCTVTGNNCNGCTTAVDQGTGRGHLCQDNGEFVAKSGAANFDPPAGRVFRLSNNTGITYMKIPAAGRVVTMNFSNNTTVTHNGGAPPTDYAAIKLVGAVNFVAAAAASNNLTLYYNATSGFWEETGRALIA